MKILTAIGGFLYDLLVGDSWPLALVVVAVLLGGALAERSGLVAPALLAVAIAVTTLAGASLIVVLEARAGVRRAPASDSDAGAT